LRRALADLEAKNRIPQPGSGPDTG
ncbi:MAG: hypothetical protein QOE41_4414, partial [Mycobacterium sp.]|nr:hypothetical protein [Mycobacterium sp.]